MDSKTVLPFVAVGAVGILLGAAVSYLPKPCSSKKLKLYYFDIPGKVEELSVIACKLFANGNAGNFL